MAHPFKVEKGTVVLVPSKELATVEEIDKQGGVHCVWYSPADNCFKRQTYRLRELGRVHGASS